MSYHISNGKNFKYKLKINLNDFTAIEDASREFFSLLEEISQACRVEVN